MNMSVQNRLGEIVESNSNGFVAQCYDLYQAPVIGTLVRAGTDNPTFGIVSHISTEGLNSDRKAIARGKGETSIAELYANNPQIAQLLVTSFEVVSLGYLKDSHISYGLPAQPPEIHAFVFSCSKSELDYFFTGLDFLSLLAARSISAVGQADELLISSLRFMLDLYPDHVNFTQKLVKELAQLLHADLNRLKLIIRRLKL